MTAERLGGAARALVATGYALGCGGVVWAAAERALIELPTESDVYPRAVPACATVWAVIVALVHDRRWRHARLGTVGSSIVAAIVLPLGATLPAIAVTLTSYPFPATVGELMILFVGVMLAAIVWTPFVLVYVACAYAYFDAQKTLAARPSRDFDRRAAWLAAMWTIGAAAMASAIAWGAAPGAILGAASAILALGVLTRDRRDVAYLARVEAGREPKRAVRRLGPQDEGEPLALFLDATESTTPARVLVAVTGADGGPFRAGPADEPLFAVGEPADVRARLRPALVVACIGLALAGVGGLRLFLSRPFGS